MIRDRFIEKIADKCDVSYEEMLEIAERYIQNREYKNMGSNTRYEGVRPEEWEVFWKRYHRIAGQQFHSDWNIGHAPFRCAC